MGFYDRMRYENRFDSLNEALSKEERATLQKLLGKMSDRDKKNLLNSKSSKSSSKTSSDSSRKKMSKEASEYVKAVVDGYKNVIKQIQKAAATAKSDEKKKAKIDSIIDDEYSEEYGNDNIEYEMYYAPFEVDAIHDVNCSHECASFVKNNEGGYVIALDTNSLNSNYSFDSLGDLDDYEFYLKYCRKEVANSIQPLCEGLANTLGNGWRVQIKDPGSNADFSPIVLITYKESIFKGTKSASGSAAGNIQSKIVEAIKFLENKQSFKMPALKAAVSKFFDGTGVVMFGGEMYDGGRTVKGTDGKPYNILKMNFGDYEGPSAGPYGEDTHGFGFAIPGKVNINIKNIWNACLEDANKDEDLIIDGWFGDISNLGEAASISVGYAGGNTYVLIFESSM